MSETNLVKIGFAMFALTFALFPFMPRLELLLVPAIIYGIGQGIVIPCLQTYVTRLAPSEYRAALMSLYATMVRVGQTVGPPVCGLVYIYADFEGTFFFGAVLALATAIVGFIGGKMIH